MFRYNPEVAAEGKNPLQLDSKAPSIPIQDYMYNETRFKMVTKMNPDAAKEFLERAQKQVSKNWKVYENMAKMDYSNNNS